MARLGGLTSKKTPAETRHDIDETFAKWGIDEYRVPRDGRGDYGEATVIFYVNDQKQDLSCSRFSYYRDNLRAVYLILESLRKAQERGILQELARAAIAMLPPGVVKRLPHDVLGVATNAPLTVAEAAYRALAKERHPDIGGSNEAMRELIEAIEAIRAQSTGN
ncbi:hypothetical protein LCGC14_1555530 [marine sediment metagenome]|uniref:J domain-containing protein n=1 Tax=marine sediment metagenome TaxID=412755 RepID=A0A0F9IP15_9ZZZZ